MVSSTLSLSTLLSVAAVLTGTEKKTNQSPNIATVLKSRLVQVYGMLDEELEPLVHITDKDRLEYMTAKMALLLVERMQAILDPVYSDVSTSEQAPPLGTRDLSLVRTLLSIVFNWTIRPLSAVFELHRPGPSAPASGYPQIIDLTERQSDLNELPSLMSRLLFLIFSGTSDKIRQTWITTSLLNYHAVDMLTPCLLLGWLPKSNAESLGRDFKDIRALTIRIINILHPHEAITALGTILSSSKNNRGSFPHVAKACSHLLSSQLKRPGGVQGLCIAIFGEDTEDVETAPLEKLEHIAKVLRTVPSTARPEEYFQFMIPRILELLSPTSSEQNPPLHKRAAAFSLSRMLSPSSQHYMIASAVLLPLLHKPFLPYGNIEESPLMPHLHSRQMPSLEALKTLQGFLLHTDPSPVEISILLTPIIPELYTLLSLHRSSKTVDPTVREILNSLLNTWGRIVSSSDVIECLYNIVDGAGGDWELNPDGFARVMKPSAGPSISLLTAAEIEASSKDDIDINANPFNLRPDPSEFVGFLRTLDRKDVSSEVFVRLLNDYQELKELGSDPMRTLLHLQLILQVQSQLSATILSRPDHVLSFIKHALASEPLRQPFQKHKGTQKRGLGLQDLRVVDNEGSDEGDSDDEEDGDGVDETEAGGKDEMVVTAITLLLSILEGNSDISPDTNSDLNDILASLQTLTSHTSLTVRQLAREARLVLTARTASTSSQHSTSYMRPKVYEESAQELYQKALKLLQDPIIPVRAHGLQLLRDLVSGRSLSSSSGSWTDKTTPSLDPALIPGILSIFLQSIQDDESYLFLNAVQGLAAMVDGYGKEVLRGMMDVYLSGTGVGGSGGGSMISKDELNARIRVGEALNTVVKRCGNALGLYVEILVPPLLRILRSSHLPATLRTSSLSILAQCMGTHAPALTNYTPGLADTCVELIQLESVTAKSTTQLHEKLGATSLEITAVEEDDEKGGDSGTKKHFSKLPEPTDVDPVTGDAKVAPFRRSALHFISQLLRTHIGMIYDSRRTIPAAPSMTLNVEGLRWQEVTREAMIPQAVIKRARLVLGYVTTTDEDAVVRVMAREALELIDQYREASLGF